MKLLQIHEPGETPLPHSGGAAVGIDLGTTHSVVAIASDGRANVLHDMCGGPLVPSVVYYGADGVREVGKRAHARQQAGEAGAISSIKRLMGRGSQDAAAMNLPYAVEANATGMVRLRIGARSLTPVEISADILRHMKQLAEQALSREVTQAVITVPAYFDDAARQATKDAALLAGLELLRLINEPTAAALAYGLDSGAEGVYAIYDLGGGTFDISILKLEKGVFQVLATGGDIALGGDDFDHAIAALLRPEAISPPLLAKARAVKEALSESKEAVLENEGQSHRITRAQLEALMKPSIDRTLVICAQALEDARLSAQEVKGVVLVGGSTRAPYVKTEIERFFGQAPLADINPDEVVAVGAAIQAEALTRGSDNLLLDVVPLSLGLETMGGITEKIIHRNTPIPVAARQSFTTYKDGQTGMEIHVLQGEREMVEQNRSLARFELTGIPPLPAGVARIEVTFAVDADGLLSVIAREETTGIEQSLAVKPSYGLSGEEIERMLMESMRFAKEDITERLLREASVEAARTIEEVESALKYDIEMTTEQERSEIRTRIAALEKAIGSGDRDRVDFERDQLNQAVRPFAERRMDKAIQSALKGAHIKNVAQN